MDSGNFSQTNRRQSSPRSIRLLVGIVGFAYRLESKQLQKGTSEEFMKAYKVSKV